MLDGWDEEKKNKKEEKSSDWGKGEKKKEVVNEENGFSNYFLKEIPSSRVYLLYGDTGVGKTFLSMDFPEPIYVIDTESRASANVCNYPNKNIKIFCPLTLPVNAHKTLNNIRNFLKDFAEKVKKGEIKEGTLVIDSVTDIWSFVQHESIQDLSEMTTKDGTPKANMTTMRLKSQMDWRIPNSRNFAILGAIRNLIFSGINVVLTARENVIPEYVKSPTNKHKIRCQKDVPFMADIILKMAKNGKQFISVIEKLGGKEPPNKVFENIRYEKLKGLIENEN